jgi:hypothetical protein
VRQNPCTYHVVPGIESLFNDEISASYIPIKRCLAGK